MELVIVVCTAASVGSGEDVVVDEDVLVRTALKSSGPAELLVVGVAYRKELVGEDRSADVELAASPVVLEPQEGTRKDKGRSHGGEVCRGSSDIHKTIRVG